MCPPHTTSSSSRFLCYTFLCASLSGSSSWSFGKFESKTYEFFNAASKNINLSFQLVKFVPSNLFNFTKSWFIILKVVISNFDPIADYHLKMLEPHNPLGSFKPILWPKNQFKIFNDTFLYKIKMLKSIKNKNWLTLMKERAFYIDFVLHDILNITFRR
jgi:hypothetical protein